MEEKLKKINSIEDLAVELLGIFKDGMLARIVIGKIKPLTYRISKLEKWAVKDSFEINDINDFINICNEYIKDSTRNYEVIGRLGIKGENIIALN